MTNSIGEIEDAKAILSSVPIPRKPIPSLATGCKRPSGKGPPSSWPTPAALSLQRKPTSFLQLLPGTNVALLNGMAHVIIKEGLVDKVVYKTRTEGFNDLKMALEKYTPELCVGNTGVPAEDIEKAARLYAKADSAAILYTMGITQHTSGTN
jgi:anaerobic selenocysteine-containing dehydrogenase